MSLLELVRVEGKQLRKGVQHVQGAIVYRLRGDLLPLVFLDRALELDAAAAGKRLVSDEPMNIVVLQADDRQFGLVVDAIGDTDEIVVKPLGKMLKTLGVFAGATIMGDGRVALILDVLGLARHAGIVSMGRERLRADKGSDSEDEAQEKDPLLLFRIGEQTRMAIPLSLVARIEEIDRASVEEVSGGRVIQYRGELLPLVELARVFGKAAPSSGPLQVIVHVEQSGRSVGFVVDQILDIVEHATAAGPSCVIADGKVAEVIDVARVLAKRAA